jgi:hypothetical protein
MSAALKRAAFKFQKLQRCAALQLKKIYAHPCHIECERQQGCQFSS